MADTKILPLRYHEKNILYMSKGEVAVYIFPLSSYPFASEMQKRSILSYLNDFFQVYHGKGKIVILNRLLSAEEVLSEIDKIQQSNPFPNTYREWKEEKKKALEQNKPWTPVMYLVLDIPRPKMGKVDVNDSFAQGGLKGVLSDLYYKLSSAGKRAIGQVAEEIDEEEKDRVDSAEDVLYNSIRSTVHDIKKAAPEDVEFYLRAPFYRGISDVPLRKRIKAPAAKIIKNGRSFIRPLKSYMLNVLSNGVVEEDWNHILVRHGSKDETDKMAYQSSMVLTAAPDDITDVDNEWLYWLMNAQFPIDVCINFEISPPDKELKKVRTKQHTIQGNMETLSDENIKVSQTDYESQDKGERLEYKLSKGQPMMYMEVTITLAGKSKEEVNNLLQIIRNQYKTKQYEFVQVLSKQEELFEKFFPWSKRNHHWTFPCDPGFVASGGIHCTSDLGTKTGGWLGTTRNGKPILIDYGYPMRNNMAGTILLLASMGGGKSATKKKIMKEILLLGGYGFSIDPKDEDHVFLEIPEIREQTKVIKFGAGMDSTKLNVFKTSSVKDRAYQNAKDYLHLLLNVSYSPNPENRKIVLSKVLQMTMARESPNMFAFIEDTQKFMQQTAEQRYKDEAQIILDILESYQDDPIAKIVFHDEDNDLALDQYRLVIANVKGLKMPKKGMDISKADDSTKLSLGVIYLVGALGRELMQHRSNKILKFFASDEHWIWEGVEELQNLTKELVKMSRSQYVVPIFSTQEGADIKTPDVRNNIGWVFCGKMGSEEEIKDAMKLLEIHDPDPGLMMMFKKLQSGSFFVRDPWQRKDIVNIFQPQKWLEIFKTTPEPEKEEAA